jgi:carbonic anhydrase
MDYLFEGVKEFSTKDFNHFRELFEGLGKKQSPHSLFIGCSDSRIVPHLITKTLPGELFIIRNIANVVPYYRSSEEYLSTTSAVEYAVKMLNVENIIVCGHSNCGGCNALYLSDDELKETPHTRKWLELVRPVKERIEKDPELVKDTVKREWVTEQLNIVEQMNHLLSYPYILERYNKKEINILGWYYIIETGEIFNYDKEEHLFNIIE